MANELESMATDEHPPEPTAATEPEPEEAPPRARFYAVRRGRAGPSSSSSSSSSDDGAFFEFRSAIFLRLEDARRFDGGRRDCAAFDSAEEAAAYLLRGEEGEGGARGDASDGGAGGASSAREEPADRPRGESPGRARISPLACGPRSAMAAYFIWQRSSASRPKRGRRKHFHNASGGGDDDVVVTNREGSTSREALYSFDSPYRSRGNEERSIRVMSLRRRNANERGRFAAPYICMQRTAAFDAFDILIICLWKEGGNPRP